MTTKDAAGSEFRYDPLRACWILSAPARSLRPGTLLNPALIDSDACPFCPGNETHTPSEILAVRPASSPPDSPGWEVRVVPNKYPAVLDAVPSVNDARRRGGFGSHEVIIETPNHNEVFFDQTVESLTTVLRVFSDRIHTLRSDPRIGYVVIFKNSGKAAGASVEHPHCQLMALQSPPTDVSVKVKALRAYREQSESCLLCDLAAEESRDDQRLLELTKRHIVFCPYASRVPFETHILPRAHTPSFDANTDAELEDVARLLSKAVRRLSVVSDELAYNLVLHTAPWEVGGTIESSFHWHIELLPRLTGLAGFELGTGTFINPVTAEEAAKRLRAAESP